MMGQMRGGYRWEIFQGFPDRLRFLGKPLPLFLLDTCRLIQTAVQVRGLPIPLPGMAVASPAARARSSKQRRLSSDKDRT